MTELERSGFLEQQIAKLSTVLAEPVEGDEYELEIISLESKYGATAEKGLRPEALFPGIAALKLS